MLVGVADHFGFGPFTVWPLSRHNEPFHARRPDLLRRRRRGAARVSGHRQSLPTPSKTTDDFPVERGYGRPETWRLPYNDFGIVLYQAVIAGPDPQTIPTASYGANRLGFDAGEFVHRSGAA
jgi:hypothetical protein